MDNDEIKIIWEKFNNSFEISQEIKELKDFCEILNCKYKKKGFEYCKMYSVECELKNLILILKEKWKYIEKGED
jgi:hypothetical protein